MLIYEENFPHQKQQRKKCVESVNIKIKVSVFGTCERIENIFANFTESKMVIYQINTVFVWRITIFEKKKKKYYD